MASAMVRTLLVCRAASTVSRSSGAFFFQSRSRARSVGGVCHGCQWSLVRLIVREFSRKARFSGARAPVPIAAVVRRDTAASVKEQLDDESEDLQEAEEEEEDEPAKERIGRNASKKQSARAREWGRELATLSPAQLRQACKWASLDEDVYDAVMLVKNLGTSSKVKHGRRRQYNYIGGLLRDVDTETMESVLKATKDGDVEGLVFIPANEPEAVDDRFQEEVDEEEGEGDDGALQHAESWLQGLLAGDGSVEDEVYSIYDVDFDRQELKKLVREARKYGTSSSGAGEAERGGQEPSEAEISNVQSKREKAEKTLLQFLVKLFKERSENAYDDTAVW